MDRLVFVDIGAHNGQTVEEVIKPQYAFDKIIAIEPMPRQNRNLHYFFGHVPTLEIFHCGLSDKTGKTIIYGDNKHLEASIHPTKPNVNEEIATECDFFEASEFFRKYLSADDVNIVKINCEGAEIAILSNLIDSGEIWKITKAAICWDVSKIPGMEEQEQLMKDRFEEIGFDAWKCPPVTGETHQDRIAYWLHLIGAY